MPTDEAKQEQNSSVWHRLQRDPALAFWLGVISLVVGVGTWWFSRSTVKPVYRVFPVETVARRESPRLSVLWDGKPIPNLCVTKVALWNEGNTPLGQERFPSSDPLRIESNTPIDLLAVELANSSRPTLTMSGAILPGRPEVRLSLNGGDAIENGDGVAFRILFAGDCASAHLFVKGRVIGSPDGFTESADGLSGRRLGPFAEVLRARHSGLGLIAFICLSLMALTYHGTRRKENVKVIVSGFSEVILTMSPRTTFIMLCGGFLFGLIGGLYLNGYFTSDLPWLPH